MSFIGEKGRKQRIQMGPGEKCLLEQHQNPIISFSCPTLIPPALQPPDLREWPEDKSPQQEVLFSGILEVRKLLL